MTYNPSQSILGGFATIKIQLDDFPDTNKHMGCRFEMNAILGGLEPDDDQEPWMCSVHARILTHLKENRAQLSKAESWKYHS